MSSLYKLYLFKLLSKTFTYILCVAFVIYSVLQFFLVQQFSLLSTTDLHRFFLAIPYASVLFIPALVAIIPLEKNELSLPCNVFVIPLAKTLSLLTVFVFALLLTFLVPINVSFFGDIEFSALFCGYIGLLLYATVSVVLCVFLFTVINHTGFAFVLSATFLAIVNAAHLFAVYINLPSWIITLFRYVSFSWHFDSAGKGILDSRDIIFYFATSLFFYFATILVTEIKRANTSLLIKKIILLLFATFILLVADSSKFYFRIDTTLQKKFSVTDYSKTLLSEVQENLSITYYRSNMLKDLYPQVSDIDDFLQMYASCSKNISYTVVDPAKQNVETRLEQYGITGQPIQTVAKDSSYSTQAYVYSAIALTYLDKTEVIPFILSTSTLEYELASRVQYLVRGTQRFVQVVVGNGLTLQEDYSYLKLYLESQGFYVAQTYLPSQKDENSNIFTLYPNVPLVVLGTSLFTDKDADALSYFITKGGKVFIATTPYTVELQSDWSVTQKQTLINDNVVYMLQDFGVYYKDSITADVSNFLLTLESDNSSSSSSKIQQLNYSLWPVLQSQTFALNGMSLFWPCAIDTDEYVCSELGFYANKVLLTSKNAWQLEKVENNFVTNPFITPKYAEPGDEVGQFALCVSLYKQESNEPSVFILGDQYAFSSFGISYSSNASGILDLRSMDFLLDCLLTLSGNKSIISLKNKGYSNNTLYKVSATDFIPTVKKCLIFDIVSIVLILSFICVLVNVSRYSFNKKGVFV